MLTLGFLDASELRVLFASPDEAEAALLKLATDVVAPLNELRAKAAAPGAIGALGGLAMAGAAGLAFAGILEVETAMATAGAVAALGGAVASSVAAECPSAKGSRRGRAGAGLMPGSRRGLSATVLGQRALADHVGASRGPRRAWFSLRPFPASPAASSCLQPCFGLPFF